MTTLDQLRTRMMTPSARALRTMRMGVAVFDTERAAEALVHYRNHGRLPEGIYMEQLWDLGMVWNVPAHEGEGVQQYDYLDRPMSGWAVSDRGQRYIEFYGLEA